MQRITELTFFPLEFLSCIRDVEPDAGSPDSETCDLALPGFWSIDSPMDVHSSRICQWNEQRYCSQRQDNDAQFLGISHHQWTISSVWSAHTSGSIHGCWILLLQEWIECGDDWVDRAWLVVKNINIIIIITIYAVMSMVTIKNSNISDTIVISIICCSQNDTIIYNCMRIAL